LNLEVNGVRNMVLLVNFSFAVSEVATPSALPGLRPTRTPVPLRETEVVMGRGGLRKILITSGPPGGSPGMLDPKGNHILL